MPVKNCIPCYNDGMSTLYLFDRSNMNPARNYLYEIPKDSVYPTKSPNWKDHSVKVENFQFIRIGLEISIKVALDQEKIAIAGYDYVQIDQDDKLYRFFVTHMEQIALETIRLDLRLDVLNTFFVHEIPFSVRTHTTRKHKKCWASKLDLQDKVHIQPIIDRFPENINPSLEKIKDVPLYPVINEASTNLANYSTRTQGYRLDGSGTLYPDAGAYSIFVRVNPNTQYSKRGGIDAGYIAYGETLSDYLGVFSGDNFTTPSGCYIIGFSCYDTETQPQVNEGSTLLPYEPYYPAGDPDYYIDRKWYLVYYNNSGHINTLLTSNVSLYCSYGGQTYQCGTIDDVDREDVRILKIVEIPLPPFAIEVANDNAPTPLPSSWSNIIDYDGNDFPASLTSVDDYAYKGNELMLDLEDIPHYGNTYNTIAEADIYTTTRSFALRPDPKLLNSEFSELKILCDSWSFLIRLENFVLQDPDYFIEDAISLRFNYYVTDNYDGSYLLMASRDYNHPFIETTDDIAHDPTIFKVVFDTDFDLLLLCDRTYEVPIYTSDYLQYVNYGYKYDKQKLDTELESMSASSGISIALSMAGAIGAGIFGGPLGLVAGIGAVVGTTSSAIIKQIKSATTGNLDLQQKLSMLKTQNGNVSGNSKASLLYRYNSIEVENQERASQYAGFRWQLYQPRIDVMRMLDNLFYLTGYACNEIGKPNVHTKLLFDHIECEADFQITNDWKWQGLTIDYIEDAKEKFRQGVTIFHDKTPSNPTLCTYDDTMTKFNFDAY